MGLIKENYKTKQGKILTTAYAIYNHSRKIGVNNETRIAYFNIYETRADYENGDAPYETLENRFVWDRKKNLVEQAYEEAKKPIKTTVYNQETGESEIVLKDGLFTGWVNHIVGE